MPRCQRTFRRLTEGLPPSVSGGPARWVCPHCPEGETYETVADADLIGYAQIASNLCERDFGPPQDRSRPTLLLLGLRPECVLEATDRRYDLYLQHGSDPFQLRLQIGHEIFHRACSQGRIFHWTHEMLACLVSVRLLRHCGLSTYADETANRYAEEAEALSAREMQDFDMWMSPATYPRGYYGRAYLIGLQLEQAVGWPTLCRLARSLDTAGAPDLAKWLSKLPESARTACEHITGITTITVSTEPRSFP